MSKAPSEAVDPTSPQFPAMSPERLRPMKTRLDNADGSTFKYAQTSSNVLPPNFEPLALPAATDLARQSGDESCRVSKKAEPVEPSSLLNSSNLPTATDLKTLADNGPRQSSRKSIGPAKASITRKDSSRLVMSSSDMRRGDEVGQSSRKSKGTVPSGLGRPSSPLDATGRKSEIRHKDGVRQALDEAYSLETRPLEDSQRRHARIQKEISALQPLTGRFSPRETIARDDPMSTHIYTSTRPLRNPRRDSINTEDSSLARATSTFPSTEARPSGLHTRSGSNDLTMASKLHIPKPRNPDRISHAPDPDNLRRDRATVPPVSLGNLGLASEGHSRSQPRAGSKHSGDIVVTSTKASVAAYEARESTKRLRSIRNNVMVNYLYQQAAHKLFLTTAEPWQGVVLKQARGDYACSPPELSQFTDGLYNAVLKMNIRCAMTVDTHVTQTILKTLAFAEIDHVPLPGGLQVQVVKKMADLRACQLHHFAAFVRELEVMVVWDDDPENLLTRAEDLQAQFVQSIWFNGGDTSDGIGHSLNGDLDSSVDDKKAVEPGHLEAACEPPRQIKLNCPLIMGVTLCLLIVCLGFGWRKLALEIKTDGRWQRLALLAAVPMQMFASMFFFYALVGSLCRMFGPVSQLQENSRWYSGKAPTRRLNRVRDHMPHVTIQMPVYKEGLRNVIRPTILAVKGAISTYEMQGGTASIFVNDDGMQLIPAEEARARRDFYDEHQIGWVARPGHGSIAGPGLKPFFRRGKFKKASNMNFCLNVSNKVEARLEKISRPKAWTHKDEDAAYKETIAAILKEDQGRTWAEGNIRIGEHILIIDSDTRVPKDCLLDAMSEMEQSPDVAIIQFKSGVMNVTDSFFERGMTWFTDMIYNTITWAVAGGDATPFVGHNAILRWSAIQTAAAYHEPVDGHEKYWSEDHVSEDFAMSLQMLTAGYNIRYASYTGDGFQEGVSLTVYDELARWEKYAYGVNEIIFHPFRKWITRGPFTPLFRSFITNKNIPSTHKLTICAYLGTYYAISSAFLMTAMNYFLTGWEYGIYDKFYQDSFSVFLSIVTVFTLLGNISLATVRYRLKQGGLLENLWKNLSWVPFFIIFLGGISLHLSQSILCHFFEIDMSWGATSKEAEDTVFGKEVVRILKRFKGTFFLCGLSITAMVYLGVFAPYNWQIRHFPSIFPFAMLIGCHLALPLLLNPSLMRLSW